MVSLNLLTLPDSGLSSRPNFLSKILMIHNTSDDKISKLIDLINSLQDELNKIDAFKRQLPFCMLLLNDAIATLRHELTRCEKFNEEPVLEQFIPLKNTTTDQRDCQGIQTTANIKDKINWMSSVQLWNPDISNKNKTEKEDRKEIDRHIGKNRTEETNLVSPNDFPGLSLCTPEIKNLRDETSSISKSSSCRSESFSATNKQQTAKKHRRSWSPELHRNFVNALQQLGGSQVATPKQIRELMGIDGLTNDEVKSHLQKYRIHTRRVSPTSKQSNTQSGSPEGPLNLAGSSRVTSMTRCDSMEIEDDEKSVSHSWKSKLNLSVV